MRLGEAGGTLKGDPMVGSTAETLAPSLHGSLSPGSLKKH